MMNCQRTTQRQFVLALLVGAFLFVAAPCSLVAEPSPEALSDFNSYVVAVESRLAAQHRSATSFIARADSDAASQQRLRQGERIVERLSPASDPPGAMLHHWRGTAFAPGAKAADFERLMKNFSAYPQIFAPQVLSAKVTAQEGDHLQTTMRVRQHHVITVVMDTAYDVRFARLNAQHGYSLSRSTHINEIDAPGTAHEHALGAADEHGFLWRMNTYWSYEERDGGLYMQIESVSLSRSVPTGLGWAVRPFVESVPRESMEFTLRSTCNALKK